MALVFNDFAQASADLLICLLDDPLESKAIGRKGPPDQSDSGQLLQIRVLSVARDSSNNLHDKSMSSISLGASYTSFGTSSASLCYSRWEPVTKAIDTNNSPTIRFLPTIPRQRLLESFNSESTKPTDNLGWKTPGETTLRPAVVCNAPMSGSYVRPSPATTRPSLAPMKEALRSTSRRQLLCRAQSEKSLGASQRLTVACSLPTMNRFLLLSWTTMNSELKNSKAAAFKQGCPPRQEVLQKSNSRRKLFVRQDSEKGLGA
jgi:hypothetical protein